MNMEQNQQLLINTNSELLQNLRLECHVGGEWQCVTLQGRDGRWSGQLEQIAGALEWRREPRVFRVGLTLAPEGEGVWGCTGSPSARSISWRWARGRNTSIYGATASAPVPRRRR